MYVAPEQSMIVKTIDTGHRTVCTLQVRVTKEKDLEHQNYKVVSITFFGTSNYSSCFCKNCVQNKTHLIVLKFQFFKTIGVLLKTEKLLYLCKI